MSAGRRSFGVGFFALTFTASSFLGIVLWSSSLFMCLGQPTLLADAAQHLSENPRAASFSLWYENTVLFLYFFIGIGLWRLRPWAYRLLILVLAIELLKSSGMGLKIGMEGNPVMAGQFAGQCVAKIFLLIFFLRKKVRDQFEEVSAAPKVAELDMPAIALGPIPSVNFTASEIIRQTRHEEGEATGELERLAGSEKVLCWVVMLAGIFLSLKQKMTIVTGGLFGGLWGLESYIICFYLFRARKLPTLAGGSLSVAVALFLSVFSNHVPEGQWLGYAINLIPGFFGGVVAGLMTRYNRWFHGSSAGFVWAIFYFLRDFYHQHGWTPALEKLDFLQILYASLIILVIGLLGGCLGGLVSAIRLGRASLPGKNSVTAK